jgi:hypothetical protein
VGTVIQNTQQRNAQGQPRWDRFARADLFEQYRELRTQGISERQAAQALKVPRSTLQAWRVWHDTLDICPQVADFFQRGPGLAFLHRIVIAFHLVCVEVGACGIRLVCLFLHLTGLDRFVAASYGAQQQVNLQIEHAMVTYRHDETARLANGMPHKDLTVTQDETFTGGLCLITMDPESNFIIGPRSWRRPPHLPLCQATAPQHQEEGALEDAAVMLRGHTWSPRSSTPPALFRAALRVAGQHMPQEELYIMQTSPSVTNVRNMLEFCDNRTRSKKSHGHIFHRHAAWPWPTRRSTPDRVPGVAEPKM